MHNFITSNIRGERCFFYQYNDNYFRIVSMPSCRKSGFEEIKNSNNINNNNKDFSDSLEKSLSRTKRNIREIALCNNFTHFATLTINSKYCDRFSLTACQDKLKYLIKERIRRKNKDFAYIFITEKHKNGAFHFHGLIKGLNDMYLNNNGYFSHKAFDELGFNSFLKISLDSSTSYLKVCNYITKYISKDCIKNDKNQIYISSRGLKKATRYEIFPVDFPKWDFINDYCKIKDIDVTKVSFEDYNILLNIVDKKNLL